MPQSTASTKSDENNAFMGDVAMQQLPASLGTFLAPIQFDNQTISPVLRGFCDTGAQVNLITESCAQAMQLRREKIRVPIEGLGSSTVAAGIVHLTLTHRYDSSVQIPVSALVVPRITGRIPDTIINSPFDKKISAQELADPAYKQPANIDMLLGAGTWAEIITNKMHRVCFKGRYAIAQLTALGWIIFGHMFPAMSTRLRSCHATIDVEDAKIDQLLIKFWNADAIPKERQWSVDEQRAEEIFVSTHRREQSGRYTVTIPFMQNKMPLGDSARTAKACFLGVERRLHREPILLTQYRAVFDDYRSKRHMVLAPE